MRYLLDTNVLLRIPHRSDPLHLVIRDALRRSGDRDTHSLPRGKMRRNSGTSARGRRQRGGFGLPVEETARRLRLLERAVTVLPDPPSGYERWKRLLEDHRVVGVQVHDARLVATMLSFRIKRILTANAKDFQRYSGIEAVTPQAAVTA